MIDAGSVGGGSLFELHLLESGISGRACTTTRYKYILFELHLLESGISGKPDFKAGNIKLLFELHLLESGISGEVMIAFVRA